ncbi:MAG TPA: hypothetical protein VMT83_01355 [Burkholderiaceae bacterium]|nr:hypothetical protein [Burkholderiaceae bacterium]
MRSVSRLVTRACARPCLGLGVLAATVSATAQNAAQMEYERQQREYWRQQEQQRQEQQRQQQVMQDNARRQQQESARLNAPTNSNSGAMGGAYGGNAGGAPAGSDAAAAQKAAALRAMWLKRPPLAPDANPLLGRWQRPAETRGNPSDPFAGMMAMAKGGLCEVLFGSGGVFEFRADRLMGMDQRTPAEELDRVEYRGDAKHVVVLPKTTLNLIEFDVLDANRVQWTAQPNCVLVRAGTTSPTAAGPKTAPAHGGVAASPKPSAAAAGGGGVLALSVGAAEPGDNILGRKLWVLTQDPQMALIRGGMTSTPSGSVLHNWVRACDSHAPDCQKGILALKPHSLGIIATGPQGQVRTPPLPAGRYWVFTDTKVAGKHWVWSEPVDVKGGEASLVLDRRNATLVN